MSSRPRLDLAVRFVGIRKHAGSDHAKELREFIIDGSGFHVERKAIGLSGILTGQTQGALRRVADEVLPSLDEAKEILKDISESGETSELLIHNTGLAFPGFFKPPRRGLWLRLPLLIQGGEPSCRVSRQKLTRF